MGRQRGARCSRGRVAAVSALSLLGLVLVQTQARSQSLCSDCDGDGIVSPIDFAQAAIAALEQPTLCALADANRDGVVSVEDVVFRVANPASDCAPTATVTATASPTPTIDNQNPPSEALALSEWLRQGRYLSWHSESQIHPSGGPHGGTVRTFLNDLAFNSLTAGNLEHPKGASVVKELYFNQPTVQEWAVETKLESDSANGQNWYWYEGVGLSGRGLRICTGCHGANYRSFISKDFILTAFPLQ